MRNTLTQNNKITASVQVPVQRPSRTCKPQEREVVIIIMTIVVIIIIFFVIFIIIIVNVSPMK